ncbi:MAG: hypothetical protein C5B52_19110 [Bacteroidetes bacterium]|nr:MAG: hypothetical protein C5B52_19110 [Bacteroidota bacterium]
MLLRKNLISVFLLGISLILFFLISIFSRVNSVSTGILQVFILTPVLIVQAVLLIVILLSKKPKPYLWVQAILSLFVLYCLLSCLFPR